jgi:PAS domain S-box-containing protein
MSGKPTYEELVQKIKTLEQGYEEFVQVEDKFRQQSHFLQELIDSIPNPIFYKNENAVYLGCNKAFEKFLEIASSKIIGKTVHDLSPKEQADKYHKMDVALLNEPGVQIYEYSVVNSRGKHHDVLFNKATINKIDGSIGGLVGIIFDITERKQMETELLATRDDLENKVLERTKELDYVNAALMAEINEREKIQTILSESELRYRTLFLRSCIGILVLSLSRKITEVNELFARMHGFSIPEMLSMRLKDFVTPETHRLAYEVSGRIMAGEILTAEVEHYHKDGHVLALEVTVSIISSDGGDSAVLCLYRDITEHKQAERDRIAREVAEEANLIKSLFVANMSHEIRTPLNAILGFAQVLERDPLLTSAQAEHVRIITHSGAHLLRLIGDILDISKIESGRITLAEATFSLHDLLSDMETMFRFHVNAKGLQLVMERDANTPRYVTGDEGRLRQVFVHLMGNASKFTVTGWIAVRVRSDVVADKTGGDAKALRLVVEVEDTGPGIPDEEMGWIFGSFQQGGGGVKAGGTGLGLAISRRLVEMMHGKLTVTSQVGKGSCFRFEVLLKLDAEVAGQDKLLSRRIVLEPAYIIPEATVALPKELIHAMLQAVEEGDMARMTELVAQVEKNDSATARGLQVLTDRFDYEELVRWLKKG